MGLHGVLGVDGVVDAMRPNFLTSPGTWLRTPRHITDDARSACAIEIGRRTWIDRLLRFFFGART